MQALFDRHDFPWGVQHELAKGVSCGHWTYNDVLTRICELVESCAGKTNSEAMPRLAKAMDRDKLPGAESGDFALWCAFAVPALAVL